MADAKLKTLQEKVTCTVCKATLQEPKLLQCFHTFCKQCIAQLAGSLAEEETLRCPECRAEISIPDGNNFDALKPSVFHNRILDALELYSVDKTSTAVCSVSKDHSASLSYCSECNRNFCQVCLKLHHALFRDHSIAEVKDIDIEEIILTHKEPLCKQHTKNKVQFYCNDCEKGICQSCLNSEHEEHDIVDLRKGFVGEQIVFLHTSIQCLQEKEKAIQAIVDCLEATALKTTENAELIKVEICEEAEKRIAVIIQNKQELLDEVEAKVKTVTEGRDNVVSLLRQVQSAKRCVHQLKEQGTALEIASTKKLIQERSSALIDKEFIPAQPETKFMFIANKDSLDNLESGIGVIKTTDATDPAASSVAVSSSEVEALSKIELTVVTRNSEGETNNSPDDIIKIKISPDKNVKVLQQVERKGEKTCGYFIAGVPGTFTATVTVNGEPVNNSPLDIKVGEQTMSVSGEFNMKGIHTPLKSPWGIAFKSDYSAVAITDNELHCVAVFNSEGLLLKKLGSEGNGTGQLNNPMGVVAFIYKDEIAVADSGNNRIQVYNIKTGKCITPEPKRYKGEGKVPILFNGPSDVHVKDGSYSFSPQKLIVTDSGNQRILVFSLPHWILLFQFRLGTNEQWKPLCTVAHGSKFFVSDEFQGAVHVFDKIDGVYTRIYVIDSLSSPRGLAIDSDGYLLVGKRGGVTKLTLHGRKVGTCLFDYNSQLAQLALLPNGSVMCNYREWNGGSYYTGRVSVISYKSLVTKT